MFTYLMLLRTLALPSPEGRGYDVVADPGALLQLIIAHHSFLQVYWRDLLRDIRVGRLEGGPPGVLSDVQRKALGQILAPNPGRASYLDNVLRGQGMHRYVPSTAKTGNAVSDLYFARSLTARELADLREPGKPMPDRIAKKRREIAAASAAAALAASPIRRNAGGAEGRGREEGEEGDDDGDLAGAGARAAASLSFLPSLSHGTSGGAFWGAATGGGALEHAASSTAVETAALVSAIANGRRGLGVVEVIGKPSPRTRIGVSTLDSSPDESGLAQ